MKCGSLLGSPAYALYRIVVTTGLGIPATSRVNPQWLRSSRHLRQPRLALALRPYSSYSSGSLGPSREFEVIKDRDIESSSITLIDPDGRVKPPVSLYRVLQSLRYTDPKEHVVQMAPATEERLAICKIMTGQEIYQMRKAKSEARKMQQRDSKLKSVAKEVELNWAIDRHDLAHQLNKIRNFLEQGLKVHVIMAAKRRGQQASIEERQQLLERLREQVKAVEGAKEYNPPDGKLAGTMTLFLEPKSIIRKVELPWGVTPRDLEVHWTRIEMALKRDVQVQIVLVTRRRDAPTTTEARQALLDQLRDRAKQIERVVECKPAAGELSNSVTLYFERTKQG